MADQGLGSGRKFSHLQEDHWIPSVGISVQDAENSDLCEPTSTSRPNSGTIMHWQGGRTTVVHTTPDDDEVQLDGSVIIAQAPAPENAGVRFRHLLDEHWINVQRNWKPDFDVHRMPSMKFIHSAESTTSDGCCEVEVQPPNAIRRLPYDPDKVGGPRFRYLKQEHLSKSLLNIDSEPAEPRNLILLSGNRNSTDVEKRLQEMGLVSSITDDEEEVGSMLALEQPPEGRLLNGSPIPPYILRAARPTTMSERFRHLFQEHFTFAKALPPEDPHEKHNKLRLQIKASQRDLLLSSAGHDERKLGASLSTDLTIDSPSVRPADIVTEEQCPREVLRVQAVPRQQTTSPGPPHDVPNGPSPEAGSRVSGGEPEVPASEPSTPDALNPEVEKGLWRGLESDLQRNQASMMRHIALRWRASQLAPAFSRWDQFVTNWRALKTHTLAKLRLREGRRALQDWRQGLEVQRRLRVLEVRGQRKHHRFVQKVFLWGWRLDTICNRRRRRILKTVFQRPWMKPKRRGRRSVAGGGVSWGRIEPRMVLRAWCDAAAAAAGQRKASCLMITRWRLLESAAPFTAWASEASLRRERRRSVLLYVTRWNKLSFVRSFETWSEAAAAARAAQPKPMEALESRGCRVASVHPVPPPTCTQSVLSYQSPVYYYPAPPMYPPPPQYAYPLAPAGMGMAPVMYGQGALYAGSAPASVSSSPSVGPAPIFYHVPPSRYPPPPPPPNFAQAPVYHTTRYIAPPMAYLHAGSAAPGPYRGWSPSPPPPPPPHMPVYASPAPLFYRQ